MEGLPANLSSDARDILERLVERCEIDCRYLYDARGSALFEEITRTDEYYPTRKEKELIEAHAASMARLPCSASDAVKEDEVVLELGCGSSTKTVPLLRALVDAVGVSRVKFVPSDICEAAAESAAARVRAAFPGMRVEPLVGTFEACLKGVAAMGGRVTVLFLGSTLGNFDTPAAITLLRDIAASLRPRDRLLLGVDTTHKPADVIERAYNDAAGVTAAFNLNILRNVNAICGTDFDESKFRHCAVYDAETRSINSSVISTCDQTIHVGGAKLLQLREGQAIHTERSRKFDKGSLMALLDAAGLLPARTWQTDDRYHLIQEAVLDVVRPAFDITRALFEGRVTTSRMLEVPVPLRNPFIFYRGHLPAFFDLRLLRLPMRDDMRTLFERGKDPMVDKPEVCHRHSAPPPTGEWPSYDIVRAYANEVYAAVVARTARVGNDALLLKCLEHELMHQETLTYLLAAQWRAESEREGALTTTARAPQAPPSPSMHARIARIGVREAPLVVGTNDCAAWDNERPLRVIPAPSHAFDVDVLPVTNEQFAAFVADGGYRCERFWRKGARAASVVDRAHAIATQDAFAWMAVHGHRQPATWSDDGQWVFCLAGRVPFAEAAQWPAYVALMEARAYCAWRSERTGRCVRVMREEEYERLLADEDYAALAARGNCAWRHDRPLPVGTCGDTTHEGVAELVGNGWEWTDTAFAAHEGFVPEPSYPEYSADFFTGSHFVLRGAGPATHRLLCRRSFRNFFQDKYVNHVAAKFRCVYEIN